MKWKSAYLWGHLLMFFSLLYSLHPIAEIFLRPQVVDDWRSIIYADKSGYYIYLPSTFIYGWDAKNVPDKMTEKAGNGFSTEESGIIKSKYPIGVSYFEAPFFIHAYLSKKNDPTLTGFEMKFHQSVLSAVLFWTVLGLVLLAESFRKITNSFWIGWFISLVFLFGTNLFYYAVKAPGFSHPFSFFLFSALIFALPWNTQNISIKRWISVGLIIGLIFTVRTINIVFACMYIMGVVYARKNVWENFKNEKIGISLGIIASILPLIPQMLYWHYAFGSYVTNSYKGEGFTLLSDPDFSITLISIHNGLLSITPIWILVFIFLFFLLTNKKYRIIALVITSIILLEIYLCASWSSPHFGCSFGHRVFVDLIPFAALTTAIFVQKCVVELTQTTKRIAVLSILFVTFSINIVYMQRITANYNGCWPYGTYDYEKFVEICVKKTPDEVQIR